MTLAVSKASLFSPAGRSARGGVLVLGLLALMISPVLHAKSDFKHPNSFIGNAGWSGGLELWIPVGEVSAGNGSLIPMQLRFSSDVLRKNSLFGANWWCPLLESEGHQAANHVEWTTLGGGRRFLVRTGDSRFLSKDGRASAQEKDGILEITSEGWQYRYQGGNLVQAVAPGGTFLNWKYGVPGGILREEGGADLLSVTRSSEAIKIHGAFGDFVFLTLPSETNGGASWVLEFPDGRKSEIKIVPEEQGISKMTLSCTGTIEQEFRWKAGALLSDSDFSYEFRRTDTGEDILHRVDRLGRTEWYTFDTARGLATYKRQDGSRVQSWYHVEPGPRYMKCFRMDTLSQTQALISSRHLAYDSEGKLEKEWTEQGEAETKRSPGFRFISVSEAEQLHAQPHTLFVDARKAVEFEAGHIPGAVRLGRASFEADYPAMENQLKAANTLIVYCTSRQCEDSSIVATRLTQLGFESIVVFEGGWAEWWKRH